VLARGVLAKRCHDPRGADRSDRRARVTPDRRAGGRVALVAAADDQRAELARYLGSAGFDVHPCDELTVAGAFGAVVWLAGDTAGELVARVRSWLRSARPHRVVIVTGRPAALRDLAATHPARVLVLPAPAFGWDVVDALRAAPTPGPRSA
jgi:hypothetical protein